MAGFVFTGTIRQFVVVQPGLFIASYAANHFEGEHLNMVDTANVQSELLAHIQELHKKRGKLEADIIAVDSLNKERIAISAAREIDAYRHLHNLHSTRRL
jgi:hypothetical protein